MIGPRRAASRSALVAVPLVAALVAGCSSGPAASGGGAPIATSSAVPPRSSTPPSTTTTTTAPEEPGWTTLSVGPHGIAVDQRVFPQPDGTQVVVARFLHGHVDYNFHVGSQDPPSGNAAILPDSRSAVSPTEAPLLLACFNGGFKVAAGVGGTQTSGSMLVPLKPGLASLVIDTAGAATVGVWGSTVPTPGEAVASVRQNLPPLVLNGQASPNVGTWQSWGATLGGIPRVPRSALGEDAAGDLVYAAAPASLPTDLAAALISAGATTAMELDINPGTVQLDTAATPGAPLVARIPGQNRPADQCQAGWIRDFITVLATG
jgi:hypothetical protein